MGNSNEDCNRTGQDRVAPLPCQVPREVNARLPPEDVFGVAIDLGEEIVDEVRGWDAVVAMEAEVAVAPIELPEPGRLRESQSGDREAISNPGRSRPAVVDGSR